MSFVPNNVYILYSAAADNIVLDLLDGLPDDGTQVQAWTKHNNVDLLAQMWLINEVEGQEDVYTLRNLMGGTYLDLSGGSSENGTKIQGFSRASSYYAGDQQWKIIPSGGVYYRLQNVKGGTFMDLDGDRTTPGTKVHAWEHANVSTQEWHLQRVSRTGSEIDNIVRNNPYIGPNFQSYLSDGLYIVLPDESRTEIYNSTGLHETAWRDSIFDCDDFAFVAKSAVAKWGNSNIRADGIAILFGIMFGSNENGAHAYNWYLNKELDSIVFFEPQNGSEMTNPGYNGYFAVF